MAYTDRISGVESSLAIKAPVRAATTANIVLAGVQTVDSVTLAEGDRVLVKNQDSGVDNGIWIVSSGNWYRAEDFNGSRDVTRGTLIKVQEGSSAGGFIYELSTPNPIIASSSLMFTVSTIDSSQLAAFTATASTAATSASSSAALADADRIAAEAAAVSAQAFAEATLGGSAYESWADFVAATVPAEITRTSFASANGLHVLRVVEDATATVPAATTNGGARKWVPAGTVTPDHYGAAPGRGNAAATTVAINSATLYARETRRPVHFLEGSYFVNSTLNFSGVYVFGSGIAPWSIEAEYYVPGGKDVAATQIVFLSDTWQVGFLVRGISSMRACGAARDGSGFARAGVNENSWQLTSLMNADATTGAATPKSLKIGVLAENSGSNIRNIRFIVDGGGDDGLDAYVDAATASLIGSMDIGILQIGAGDAIYEDAQVLGHYRVAGLMVAAIDRDGDYSNYRAPYRTNIVRGQYEGMRGIAIRGPDKFAILAETATTVDLPWADDHPFTGGGFNTIRLTEIGTGTDAGATYTYSGVTKVDLGGGDVRVRLSGLTGFSSGAYGAVVPTSAGGANSHIVITDTQIGGVTIPAGWAANDNGNVTGALTNGAVGGLEISGWRCAEETLRGVRIQHSGSVAIYKHDGREGVWDVLAEASPNRLHGKMMRYIVSPQYNRNTHATNPAGGSRWIDWRYVMAQEYTEAAIDFRPFMPGIAPPAVLTGQDGWFETYYAHRPMTVRHYSGTGGQEIVEARAPRLAVGPEAEGPSGFGADELLHVRAATGFVTAIIEAVESGRDPNLILRSFIADYRMRVDDSSAADVIFEVDRGGGYTQIMRDEGGGVEGGLHISRPTYLDNAAIYVSNAPVYNSDAAAGGGGVASGGVYRTATGELRVKL